MVYYKSYEMNSEPLKVDRIGIESVQPKNAQYIFVLSFLFYK